MVKWWWRTFVLPWKCQPESMVQDKTCQMSHLLRAAFLMPVLHFELCWQRASNRIKFLRLHFFGLYMIKDTGWSGVLGHLKEGSWSINNVFSFFPLLEKLGDRKQGNFYLFLPLLMKSVFPKFPSPSAQAVGLEVGWSVRAFGVSGAGQPGLPTLAWLVLKNACHGRQLGRDRSRTSGWVACHLGTRGAEDRELGKGGPLQSPLKG